MYALVFIIPIALSIVTGCTGVVMRIREHNRRIERSSKAAQRAKREALIAAARKETDDALTDDDRIELNRLSEMGGGRPLYSLPGNEIPPKVDRAIPTTYHQWMCPNRDCELRGIRYAVDSADKAVKCGRCGCDCILERPAPPPGRGSVSMIYTRDGRTLLAQQAAEVHAQQEVLESVVRPDLRIMSGVTPKIAGHMYRDGAISAEVLREYLADQREDR